MDDLDALSTTDLENILDGSVPAPAEPPPSLPPPDPAEAESTPEPVEAEVESPEQEPTLDDLRAQLEEERTQRKRWEQVASRNAGRASHFENAFKAVRDGKATSSEPTESDDPLAEFEDQPYDDDIRERLDRLDKEQRDRKYAEGIQAEAARARSYFGGLAQSDIAAAVAEQGDTWTSALDMDDPDEARALARSVFLAVANRAHEIAQSRRDALAALPGTTQFDRQREARARAAVSGSGGVARAMPRTPSLNDLSTADLERLLDTHLKR